MPRFLRLRMCRFYTCFFHPQISGNQGMPSFKIRPKALSRHGRQLIQELSHGQIGGGHTFFNVAKQSRLSTMSIRHNFEVGRQLRVAIRVGVRARARVMVMVPGLLLQHRHHRRHVIFKEADV